MNRLRKIFAAFSRTEQVLFSVGIVLAVTTLASLVAVYIQETTTSVPAPGGEFSEGIVGQPVYVNPILASSETDKGLVRLLFANLADLAQKIDVDPNGRQWRVRLKEGLTWSDGQKITSDDVIFTVEEMQDPDTRSPQFASWQGVTANRSSELEVQFNLVSPYAFFEENLRHLYVAPKHLFADTPSANWRLSDFNLQPVGSGPYVFAPPFERRADGFITAYHLDVNPHYFGDRPLIDRITFRFFAKDDDLVDAFNTGEVNGLADFDPELVAKINRPYQTWSFSVPSYYAVFFNQGQHIAFKDESVRRALALAVDRQSIVDTVFDGHATVARNPLPLDDQDSPQRFDPGQAVKLLEDAGWKLNNDTGIRETDIKGTTITLEFDLIVPDIPFLRRTAELVAESWQNIGVRANIIALSPEEISDRVIKNREYHAILFGNFLNPAQDIYPFWHSSERFYPGLNLALYNNPAADSLIEQIRRNFDDSSRETELADLGKIIADDVPAVFLYSPDYLYITSKDLKGVPSGTLSDPADRFLSVGEWHLKTARTLKTSD